MIILLGASTTVSGSPIAGESYTLKCSAGDSEAESFQWLGPPDGRTPVVGSSPRLSIESSTSTSSQLQFRPVQQSDSGLYSCRATVDGSDLLTDIMNVSINGTVYHYLCYSDVMILFYPY